MLQADTNQLQMNPATHREVARRWSCGELKDVLVAESSWLHPHSNMALNLNLRLKSHTSVSVLKLQDTSVEYTYCVVHDFRHL